MAWSEYQRIRDDLKRMARIFDLTRGRLGERVLDLVVDGIERTCAAETDPDGHKWDELSEAYAAWKSGAYPGKPIGRRVELMLAREELEGGRRVVPDHATMEYGISDEARLEAGHFQERRPFYGISQGAAGEVADLLDEVFADFFSG